MQEWDTGYKNKDARWQGDGDLRSMEAPSAPEQLPFAGSAEALKCDRSESTTRNVLISNLRKTKGFL